MTIHTPKPCFIRIFIYFLTVFCAASAFPQNLLAGGSAPPSYNAGFRMLVTWNEQNGNGVEFMLWYPSIKQETRVGLGPWAVYGARDGRHADGKFPLLIISHDTGANKFSHHDTANQLASAGFVVAVPSHSSDSSNNMRDLFTAGQIFGRVEEIHLIVEFLKKGEYRNFVDTTNIGILGVGTGASTALILAGGLVDISGYSAYCNEDAANNDLCSPWIKQRLATLSFHLPQPPEYNLAGVKALALAAPKFVMLFTQESLTGVNAEVSIYQVELEPYAQSETLRDLLPTHQKYTLLPGMDGRDLAAPCTDPLKGEPTWQCDPEPDDSLELRQKLFNSSLEKFFSQQLYKRR